MIGQGEGSVNFREQLKRGLLTILAECPGGRVVPLQLVKRHRYLKCVAGPVSVRVPVVILAKPLAEDSLNSSTHGGHHRRHVRGVVEAAHAAAEAITSWGYCRATVRQAGQPDVVYEQPAPDWVAMTTSLFAQEGDGAGE